MHYLYGEFSEDQIRANARLMHNEIHKLLLYKDPNITETIFDSEDDFLKYFVKILYRFGGLNDMFGRPEQMVVLMATLRAALYEAGRDDFDYKLFRKLILDAHGYIKSMFEGGDSDA